MSLQWGSPEGGATAAEAPAVYGIGDQVPLPEQDCKYGWVFALKRHLLLDFLPVAPLGEVGDFLHQLCLRAHAQRGGK